MVAVIGIHMDIKAIDENRETWRRTMHLRRVHDDVANDKGYYLRDFLWIIDNLVRAV